MIKYNDEENDKKSDVAKGWVHSFKLHFLKKTKDQIEIFVSIFHQIKVQTNTTKSVKSLLWPILLVKKLQAPMLKLINYHIK